MPKKPQQAKQQEAEKSEFERFTDALRKIVSTPKSSLDLHKPLRPRDPKPAKA